MGRKTWPQIVAAQGYDPTDQLNEIASWNAAFDKAGVILDSDPRRVAKSGAAQQQDDVQREDPLIAAALRILAASQAQERVH
jgi:capsid protein